MANLRRKTFGGSESTARTRLRQTFWVVSVGMFILIVVKGIGQPFGVWLGAILILLVALLPSYLWVSQKVHGLPIFPLYALTATWIYALPLVYEHPMILLFPPSFQLTAALSITGYLLVGTGAWYWVARKPVKRGPTVWMFDESQKNPLFLCVLGATFLLTLAISSGRISSGMKIFSILRAVEIATQGLVCFVLSYCLAQGRLTLLERWAFYALLGAILVVSITGLLLINAMSLLGLVVLAYIIGARKLPVVLCVSAIIVFGFLHDGKGPMREKHWREEEEFTVKPLQYPAFFAEWMETSWKAITQGDAEPPEPLTQRASLMHLLLYFQSMSPHYMPFLYGESYKSIPLQFVPRMFAPDKPRSLEGSYVVLIYYGLQTREDTEITAIDVGLINEAYANFGYVGLGMLAVVLGLFFGWVANWARQMPILSFRSLFGVLVLGSIIQSSSSFGFYIASLYQATAVLFGLAVVSMRMMRPDHRRNLFLE